MKWRRGEVGSVDMEWQSNMRKWKNGIGEEDEGGVGDREELEKRRGSKSGK